MFYQLVVLCCLCVIWRLWSKKQSTLEPPELFGRLSIVGHARKPLWDGVKMYKSIKQISEEGLRKGGVVTLSLGPCKVYGVADPEDCLTIMNASLEKHYMYDFGKPFLGNGLFTADGSTWKKNRKLLNPAFNQQTLDGFIEVFNTQAKRLVDQFATKEDKPFDQEDLLRLNNLETICLTSFGIGVEENGNLLKHYLFLLTKLIKRANERIQKFWLHSDFIYNITQEKKIQEVELKELFALSKSILEKKKLERENLTETSTTGKHKTFISYILDIAHDTGCFTDEQIREETDTIIAAGHDTTGSLLTFVLTVLGSHTDVQEKVYEEILHVFGDTEKNVEKDDLSKLVYIEAVLKETLRLNPILPIMPRRIDKEVKLKNYTINANSDCFISVYGLHRHSIWGPDADQFRPERWFDKKTLPDPKFFAGFGLGRRSCIGKAYAMMSMKIIIVHVLQKYRISSDISKMVLKMHVMIRPESGHYITLTNRNKST